MFVNSLSGRFLILSIIFVMAAEVLIFVPSVARFREEYMLTRLDKAQIVSLSIMASERAAISPSLEEELLANVGVYNVVFRHDGVSQMILSQPVPGQITENVDLRNAGAVYLIRGAMKQLVTPGDGVIRVIGSPTRAIGNTIEVTMPQAPLRSAMIDYGIRILQLSAVISVISAALLYLAVRRFMVHPISRVVASMQDYAAQPEDVRRIIEPQARIRELRSAEDALAGLQMQLTGALRQKERLAQLGGAVAKISHDLRNILTTATLLADRMEMSEDPAVKRSAPKLVNSLSRAVNLCEGTLAFGRAEEPPPSLSLRPLTDLVDDVLESERLAAGDTITLSCAIPPLMMVRCDGEQLFRVLGNLVRNARQAIAATGQPGDINISANEDSANWIICVSDTGPGLPVRAQEHLFTPFEGGVRKGGTGLGLVIASELVRGHGGELSLARTDESGTEFVLRLPKETIALATAAQ